jgi:hypothetical protein
MESRSEEFGTGLGHRPPFRRKVSGMVHRELSSDLDSADDQGYTMQGQHLVVHDHKLTLSTLEAREDMLRDPYNDEPGSAATARAYGRLIGQVREHYGRS